MSDYRISDRVRCTLPGESEHVFTVYRVHHYRGLDSTHYTLRRPGCTLIEVPDKFVERLQEREGSR